MSSHTTKRGTCPYCDDGTETLYAIKDEDGEHLEHVCRECRWSYNDWLYEQTRHHHACEYDGPYFADTMSGGCIQL